MNKQAQQARPQVKLSANKDQGKQKRKLSQHERSVRRNQIIFMALSALMVIVMIVSLIRF